MTENIDDLTPSDDESETVVTRPERDPKTGRFLQGTTGLPGRPKGARNKLAEAMIEDLYQDWKAHGIQAIHEVRETRPADYLKIVAMVVSKCVDLNLDDDMRDHELLQFIEERRQKAALQIAKMREGE
jgi:hypothetical protein